MTLEKPKLAEVEDNTKQTDVETEPTSIFDDLEKLRSEATLTVHKREILTAVPIGRPNPDDYFRVHPDPSMQLQAAIYASRDRDIGTYFITRSMLDHPLLVDKHRPVLLAVTYSWPKRTVGIWPVAIDTTGRGNTWWTSAWGGYAAKISWVQLQPSTDRYTVYSAEGQLPDPLWPNKTLSELLKIAFGGRIIDSEDVPIMRRLRGLE
jgi:hypothetical protein